MRLRFWTSKATIHTEQSSAEKEHRWTIEKVPDANYENVLGIKTPILRRERNHFSSKKLLIPTGFLFVSLAISVSICCAVVMKQQFLPIHKIHGTQIPNYFHAFLKKYFTFWKMAPHILTTEFHKFHIRIDRVPSHCPSTNKIGCQIVDDGEYGFFVRERTCLSTTKPET